MRQKHGFSLVELSIVLVILGLLTGGILSGQSLIKAAELRTISTDASRYITASKAFRDKYFQMAGDINNATAFWGKDATNCNADTGTVNATTGTCNGNGGGTYDAAAVNGGTGEIFQFWKQLALAGLIEGTYTGLSGSASTTQSVIRTNVPASRVKNGGWSAAYQYPGYPGDPDAYAGEYGNFLQIGAQNGTGQTGAALLTPEDAWNVDTKLDDGRPATGMILAKFWNNLCSAPTTGAVAANNFNAAYRLSDTTPQCMLIFTRSL